MHKIDGAGHVLNTWVAEDAATNRPPTEITPEWMNAIQAEIIAVIEAAGIALDKSNNGQLLEAFNLKASLASPTFTGDPKAPTPAAADNDTSIATTAFVKTAITNLINASPAALDTLNELAAALGNDANFAATITAALALKAPLASPTFTGDPKAPTPAAADNDTSIATTAFVKTAITNAVIKASQAEVDAGLDTNKYLASDTLAGSKLVPFAMVSFRMAATPVINKQFNISSITRNSLGNYTISFTSPPPDASYSMASMNTANVGGTNIAYFATSASNLPTLKTTAAVRIIAGTGTTEVDVGEATLIFFR